MFPKLSATKSNLDTSLLSAPTIKTTVLDITHTAPSIASSAEETGEASFLESDDIRNNKSENATASRDLPSISLMQTLEKMLGCTKMDSKDDDNFSLHGKEALWTGLFGQYYMGMIFKEEERDEEDEGKKSKKDIQEDDDMLFYVSCKPGEKGKQVSVFRKDSRNIPGLGDPHISWEETVYLNLLLHDLEYTLTCAVCCRMPTQDLKVLRKQTLSVYASPHMRRMDNKGESSALSYPNIFFMVDSFDEVFRSLCVQEDEIVCVELVARLKNHGTNVVIFLGSVKYESLLKVYESKESIGSKVVQMSLSWLAGPNDHIEFIRMRGPYGKGYAEMAVGQYKQDFIENNVTKTEVPNSAISPRITQPFDQSRCTCPVDTNAIYQTMERSAEDCKCGASDSLQDNSRFTWSNTVKWFTQRKKTTVLSSHLTYVTLPWTRIMKDILQVRQKPVFLKETRSRKNSNNKIEPKQST